MRRDGETIYFDESDNAAAHGLPSEVTVYEALEFAELAIAEADRREARGSMLEQDPVLPNEREGGALRRTADELGTLARGIFSLCPDEHLDRIAHGGR